MDSRKLKEKAQESFTKGRWAKAAELYGTFLRAEPRDHQARLRMGDALLKAGQRLEAISAYTAAAEGFARDGFLPRAIAASKLILEVDPAHQGVQQMLADLYARRGTGGERPGGSLRTPPPPVLAGRVRAPLELSADPEPARPAPEKPRAIELGPIESSSGDSIESSSGAASWNDELPAELQLPTEPVREAPPQEIPIEVEAAEAEVITGVEIDLSGVPDEPLAAPSKTEDEPLDSLTNPATAAPLATPPVTRAPAAPPGLQKRRPTPAPIPPSAPVSELNASLKAFSRFEELELELTEVSARLASAVASPDALASPDGGSLLHAVEVAAVAGLNARAEGQGEALLELPDADEPGGTSTEVDPAALPTIPLFSDLPADAFIALFERCPLRRFTPGERVFEQGSVGGAFYVICEGAARVVREENAARRVVATLQEGSFFGEMALLSGAPRTASVEAADEDTQLLEISATVLAELSREYPAVAQALRKFCRQRMLSNLMQSSALFRPFDKNNRKQLVERFRARDVPGGTVVIREGERADGLYVVLSGELTVEKQGQVLAKLHEGELFGEMSLLHKSEATATVTTSRRTSLLRLPREDFDSLILSHPQILILVSELTDDRNRQNEAVLGGAARMDEEGLMLV